MGEDVEVGSGDLVGLQGVDEGGFVNEAAASSVDQKGVGAHLGKFGRSEHLVGLGSVGGVEADKVGAS